MELKEFPPEMEKVYGVTAAKVDVALADAGPEVSLNVLANTIATIIKTGPEHNVRVLALAMVMARLMLLHGELGMSREEVEDKAGELVLGLKGGSTVQ